MPLQDIHSGVVGGSDFVMELWRMTCEPGTKIVSMKGTKTSVIMPVMQYDFGNYYEGSLKAAKVRLSPLLLSPGPFTLIELSLVLLNLKTLMYQVFAGLKHLHENGIVHRDVKPGCVPARPAAATSRTSFLTDFAFDAPGTSSSSTTGSAESQTLG